MPTFTSSSFRRRCIGGLVHIASMLSSHSLAMHGDYIPLISTCIPLLVLITILQRLQIISMCSSSFTSIATRSNTPMCSVDAGQLFSFGCSWLTLVHVKLPNLVLWRPQILKYVLNILISKLLMIGSCRTSTVRISKLMTSFHTHAPLVAVWIYEI